MTGYLLDTNVISLLAPSRSSSAPAFIEWLEAVEDSQVFLSVITVHEIEKGIERLERKGAASKAGSLRLWMSGLVSTYEDRILPIDPTVAAISGRLEAEAIAAGHDPGLADALIAGTAKAHALTIVTQNRKHFEPFGVPLQSPEGVSGG